MPGFCKQTTGKNISRQDFLLKLAVELSADFREAHEQPKQRKNTKGSMPKSTTDAYQQQTSNNDGVNTKTIILPYSPYFPDFDPSDIRIFPELSRRSQGHRFQSADEIKNASQTELKAMAEIGFQKCFDDPYKRWHKCAQGSCFEGGCVLAT
ncbi:hypothetical protein TNCV_3547271 [Trichonephila clavipes]|nr:hypothetical protein TNCV_3547271 [Trichonephila clavipes]